MNRSSLAVACATLALALAPGMAQAAPTVTVNVGGTNYDVTYFEGAYDINTAKFRTPPAGQMPWWGDSELAKSFATEAGAKFGFPLSGTGGPFFAYGTSIGGEDSKTSTDFWYYESSASPNIINLPGEADSAYSYATASLTPNPSAVPGPVPLFGAAAAFGMSRRLRRRCQLGG